MMKVILTQDCFTGPIRYLAFYSQVDNGGWFMTPCANREAVQNLASCLKVPEAEIEFENPLGLVEPGPSTE